MPSKKVVWGVLKGLNTFLEGIWSPRVNTVLLFITIWECSIQLANVFGKMSMPCFLKELFCMPLFYVQ